MSVCSCEEKPNMRYQKIIELSLSFLFVTIWKLISG